jgi:hypothetical protein
VSGLAGLVISVSAASAQDLTSADFEIAVECGDDEARYEVYVLAVRTNRDEILSESDYMSDSDLKEIDLLYDWMEPELSARKYGALVVESGEYDAKYIFTKVGIGVNAEKISLGGGYDVSAGRYAPSEGAPRYLVDRTTGVLSEDFGSGWGERGECTPLSEERIENFNEILSKLESDAKSLYEAAVSSNEEEQKPKAKKF